MARAVASEKDWREIGHRAHDAPKEVLMRGTFTVALYLCLTMLLGSGAWAQIDYGDPSIYGIPVNLGPLVNTDEMEGSPTLAADELTLVFNRGDNDLAGIADLWMATRSSKSDPWGEGVELGPEINSEAYEMSASLTGDGLEIYIGRYYGGCCDYQLWSASRDSSEGQWTDAQRLPFSIAGVIPRVSLDGLTLFSSGQYPGDNFVRTRASRQDRWDNNRASRLSREINTARGESPGTLSADGLAFFFDREHGNDWQTFDMWVSQRDTLSSPWKPAVVLPEPVNVSGANDGFAWLSPDGTSLYFSSDRPGGYGSFDLWQVPIITEPSQPQLQAGDANRDLKFDQLDLVQVQIAAKYLTGQTATWGDGDWNGAPGGSPGNPPTGNNLFDQLDIVAALNAGKYLTGSYAALVGKGTPGDGQTSLIYNAGTGELAVDAPAAVQLTSINIDSAAGILTGAPATNLGGSFDNDGNNNIFKATFSSSFGSLSFGNVAQAGLSERFVLNDLSVVGSLAGGGDLGNVDLIYVPEPSTIALLAMGFLSIAGLIERRRARIALS
jgi:hypothetical protein